MDICISMSKFGYDFCTNNGIKMDGWIYPFIPTNQFYKVTEKGQPKEYEKIQEFRKGLKLQDKKVLLYVGRPGWRKNLEFTFGLLNVLLKERGRDDVVLYMHTDPDDPASKLHIGKLLHAFRIPDNHFYMTRKFNWATGVKINFINALYNLAYLYIGTHGGEGFGMPFAESMSAGCPFVATNCTSMPELAGVNQERGLLARVSEVHPDQGIRRPYVNIDDMANKVERLLDDEKLRNKMGRAGKHWVKQQCDLPVIARKWEKVFDGIAVNKAKMVRIE
jgi:glycosyltransferase involved in cell wall biosynthesis